jgi:CubicO group peptidase (beta-lactamase class C family)
MRDSAIPIENSDEIALIETMDIPTQTFTGTITTTAAAISSIPVSSRNFSNIDNDQYLEPIGDLLISGLEQKKFKGATILVSVGGEIIFFDAIGQRVYSNTKVDSEEGNSKFNKHLVFDLGSLTAPVVLNSLIAMLIANSQIELEDKVSRFLPSFCLENREAITIRQLISHTSGLSSNVNLFEQLRLADSSSRAGLLNCDIAKVFLVDLISQNPPKFAPDSERLYSHYNNIVLGYLIEQLTGLSLDRAMNRFVLQPLNINSSGYIDQGLIKNEEASPILDMFAPSAYCPIRNRVVCGEAFDLLAWGMGGISGHSGFFASIEDLHHLIIHHLLSLHGEESIFASMAMQQLFKSTLTRENKKVLAGWETAPSLGVTESSDDFSSESFGFICNQGVSTWIDPSCNSVIIAAFSRFDGSKNQQNSRAFQIDLFKKANKLIKIYL